MATLYRAKPDTGIARAGHNRLAGGGRAAGRGRASAVRAAWVRCRRLAVGGIASEWYRGTRSRHRRGEAYPAAFLNLLSGNRPRYGGYIVHIGISMLAVGIVASSFFSAQRDIVMLPGDVQAFGDYTFKYVGAVHTVHTDRAESIAAFDVWKGERFTGRMEAFRAFYPTFSIASTKGAIRSTPIEDFYIVPSEFGADDQAVFRVLINPMVWWMWASGSRAGAGHTGRALGPRGVRSRRQRAFHRARRQRGRSGR